MDDRLALLDEVARIARAAGAVILALGRAGAAVSHKEDGSPVTEADRRAEALILRELKALRPSWPVVAEEAASQGDVPAVGDRFWLVDPLDGTREFTAGSGEYTVNVALVEAGVPTLGVVFAPALARGYLGLAGAGAWCEEGAQAVRRPIRARVPPASGPVAALSRRHGDASRTERWLAAEGVREHVPAGSSLKFGVLAAGEADVYPRFGRTMEWDTAAGHAVLAAAGGSVCDLAGRPLRYGKPGHENPDFVARGRR